MGENRQRPDDPPRNEFVNIFLILTSDTLTVSTESVVIRPDTARVRQKTVRQKTVADVLKSLPANATPEQQDSAIQANFHKTERIYNTRPDTIGIRPGTRIADEYRLDNLTNYHNPYFFTDSVSYSVEGSDRFGMAADPVPYTIAGDDVITAILVGSFLFALVAINNARGFITRQIKTFFHVSNDNRLTTSLTETSNEVRFQLFLVAIASLLLSIFYFFYTLENVADTFVLSTQYELIGVYFLIFSGYFFVRFLIYWSVNTIFFDPQQRQHWNKSQLFLSALIGIMLFPLVMATTYFGMNMHTALLLVLSVAGVYELLTIAKCYLIFFNRKGGFLQIIIYFCALEIVPLIILLGTLVEINNLLKISY